jgi:hypothetical protein
MTVTDEERKKIIMEYRLKKSFEEINELLDDIQFHYEIKSEENKHFWEWVAISILVSILMSGLIYLVINMAPYIH